MLTGLNEPTNVAFAGDGRVFVAEKSGVIKVFHGLADPTPTVFADLRTNVHNFWDRGLLGITLDPQFPARPYVYVLYTYDAAPGGTAPKWGTPGATSDGCPNPPGATANGCVVSGRLSKLTANGDVMTGSEQVLVSGWCQQFPSHSMGQLAFGADGKLYASAGEGASFVYADTGQTGNPCGDPAGQGGSLRAQSLRSSGPTGLSGSVIRIDPDTGVGAAGNPLASSSNPNARRILAEGLRNPFRFTIRPGTNEVWSGDVGWNTWEEINRIPAGATTVTNFGWPCYEGPNPLPDFGNTGICQNLPASAVTKPYFTYNHNASIAPGDACTTGSSSITGDAFYTGAAYPAAYRNALFFADYARNCISVMLPGANGLPDPTQVKPFISNAAGPTTLIAGPNGDLYYTDLSGGTVHRITYTTGDNPPVASLQADKTSGSSPLTVALDASGSSDPDPGDVLTYSWDLNGDNTFGDATGVRASTTFTSPGPKTVRVRVTDRAGASSVATLSIAVGPGAPALTISTPALTEPWSAGDTVPFAGTAVDPTDGVLPPSKLSWSLVLRHCPSTCHSHPVQDYAGTDSASFTAPDHDYPSYLELTLSATDSLGLTSSKTVRLDPKTVNLTFNSAPSGMKISVGGTTGTTPFVKQVIANSQNSAVPISPQPLNGRNYAFSSWSDGAPQSRAMLAPTSGGSGYTATFTDAGVAPPAPAATVSPASVDFGSQWVQQASAARAVTVLNSGAAPLHVDSVATSRSDFAATPAPGCATLAPGASCTVGVSYTPASLGAMPATLTLTDDAGGAGPSTATQTVALTGTGVADPINDYYAKLGGLTSVLGAPVGGHYQVGGGWGQTYQAGRIYYTAATGAHEVHGAILAHYQDLGGPTGVLGFPTSDELDTANRLGKDNTFAGGTMYWSAATGAHEVQGLILQKYLQLGGPAGVLQFPTSDEAPAGAGRFNQFSGQGGSIYWSGATGAHEIQGLIGTKYLQMGGPTGVLQFPTSDELAAPGGAGRYNTFSGQGGSIYWSGATGAHEIQGLIRTKWLSIGGTTSRLGYPTSDEYAVTGGRRNDFQGGSVTWKPATGAVIAYR